VWGISPIELVQGTWPKSSGMFSSQSHQPNLYFGRRVRA
jgi:hypothetical protein